MMDAVSQGALEAGTPAAGFKIYREGGKWVGLVRHRHRPLQHFASSCARCCIPAFVCSSGRQLAPPIPP